MTTGIHAKDVFDAQPFLKRDPENLWAKSNMERDRIYNELEKICEEAGIKPLLNRSGDYVYPNWVAMYIWLPSDDQGLVRRVGMVIEISASAYHKYEILYKVRIGKDGKDEKKYDNLMRLSAEDLKAWALHTIWDMARPPTSTTRLRKHNWQIWAPKNTIDLVRRSFLPSKLVTFIVSAVGLSILYLAFISNDEEMSRNIGSALYNINLIPGSAALSEVPWYLAAYGLVLLLIGVPLFIVAVKRKIFFLNSGRPHGNPRNLRMGDSWSGLLDGLGKKEIEVRDAFLSSLKTHGSSRAVSTETISYITPDQKREREQIVVTDGRAILFCHIYAYDNDLLLAWDAHINLGEWTEVKSTQGIHKTSGKAVVLNSVTPGVGLANEYDLIDLNGLTEWVHANLVRVAKRLIAEHKLDQELDFTIVRGERQSLLQRDASGDKKKRLRRLEQGEL